MNEQINNNITAYTPVIFFILTAGYFIWLGEYVLFFQEQEALFLYSGEYLKEFLARPGGAAEYAGLFLTQFYYHPAMGAIILAAVLTLAAFLLLSTGKRIGADPFFLSVTFIIPSCLLLLMQTHYYHLMVYNLGYLAVLAAFRLTAGKGGKPVIIPAALLFVLLYYTGGGFAWIFLAMCVISMAMYSKRKSGYLQTALLIATGGLTLYISRYLIFTEPTEILLTNPLPLVNDTRHRILYYFLTIVVILYPVAARIEIKKRWGSRFAGHIRSLSAPACVLAAIILVLTLYNPQTAKVIKFQKLVSDKEWDTVIRLHESSPSRNLIGQFYYNLALAETNQLSNRLFSGKQDFGPTSLILPWGDVHLNRGGLFYYSTGLINEAHRWAYESMVIYGYRPQNLILLAETNLINGNYRIAVKYLSLLKQSFNYRDIALQYEKLLDNPEDVMAHPRLGEKSALRPVLTDFFIDTEFPQRNIPMLLESNPGNIKAFEYKIAWLLLTKEVEEIVSLIPRMKEMGYTAIPRHVEEAALVYSNFTGSLPDLGGFRISDGTRTRFGNYISAYNTIVQNPSADRAIIDRFDNTFWYYLHFY